jgi:hypothetical protein
VSAAGDSSPVPSSADPFNGAGGDTAGHDRRPRSPEIQAIEAAAVMLSYLQCPYYDEEEACDAGCWHEPACIVDEPAGGWAAGALDILDRALEEE